MTKAPLSPAIGGGWTRPHPSVLRDRPHWVYRIYDEDNNLLYVGCTYLHPTERFPSLRQWHTSDETAQHHHWIAHLYPDMDTALAVEGMWVDLVNPSQNGMRTGVAARQRVTDIAQPISEQYGFIHSTERAGRPQ